MTPKKKKKGKVKWDGKGVPNKKKRTKGREKGADDQGEDDVGDLPIMMK